MKAIVIHKALDLRIEERAALRPGPAQVSIAIGRGGICGSDLHYYRHGGFGTVRLKEPMVLGHEVSGEIVTAVGADVSRAEGRRQGCGQSKPPLRSMRLLPGRAAKPLPRHAVLRQRHAPAPCARGFQAGLVARQRQSDLVAADIAPEEAAFAEPFAVTLHAVVRAGAWPNKTGSGYRLRAYRRPCNYCGELPWGARDRRHRRFRFCPGAGGKLGLTGAECRGQPGGPGCVQDQQGKHLTS